MRGKKILFLISESFPYGRAYAARTRALSKLLTLAGNKVTIFCDEISAGRDGSDFSVISKKEKRYNKLTKLLLFPKDYVKEVDALLTKEHYDLVIARSMYDRFPEVLRTVKAHNIPLILETCECYDKKTFRVGLQSIRYWQFRKCWNKYYNEADGYIAISRYLEKHYKTTNKPIVRIPAILDTSIVTFSPRFEDRKKIKLIYSGDITGGKERIGEIIAALSVVNKDKVSITFDVYGPNEKQILDNLDEERKSHYSILKNKGIVSVHGRIPQDEMPKAISSSDFGIFIRPQRISSEAGFPTKMGEYLSAGLPIITNDTGDISLVISDGKNGFIIQEPIEKNLERLFGLMQKMKSSTISQMRVFARESAIEQLDPHAYVNLMKVFLENY